MSTPAVADPPRSAGCPAARSWRSPRLPVRLRKRAHRGHLTTRPRGGLLGGHVWGIGPSAHPAQLTSQEPRRSVSSSSATARAATSPCGAAAAWSASACRALTRGTRWSALRASSSATPRRWKHLPAPARGLVPAAPQRSHGPLPACERRASRPGCSTLPNGLLCPLFVAEPGIALQGFLKVALQFQEHLGSLPRRRRPAALAQGPAGQAGPGSASQVPLVAVDTDSAGGPHRHLLAGRLVARLGCSVLLDGAGRRPRAGRVLAGVSDRDRALPQHRQGACTT
jgi:hypothetical protein